MLDNEIKSLMEQVKDNQTAIKQDIDKLKKNQNALEDKMSKSPVEYSQGRKTFEGPYLNLKSYEKSVPNAEGTLGEIITSLAGNNNDLKTKTLVSGTNSAGGYFIAPEVSQNIVLETLSKSVCFEAGTQIYPYSSPSVRMPVVTINSGATWKEEGEAHNASSLTIGAVTHEPKTLIASVIVSQELLSDSALVQTAIVSALQNQFAQTIDNAILQGTAEFGPVGIRGTSGVTLTPANAVMSRSVLANAVYAVRNRNFEPTAVIMSERDRKKLQTLEEDETGQPLFMHSYYSMLPILSTTSIVTNEATGSPATNTGSSLICGDFTKSILGVRSDLQIGISEHGSNFNKYSVEIRLVGRFSVAVLDPKAFEVVTDITGS